MTARERWLALHHARRAFRRDMMKRLEELAAVKVPPHMQDRYRTHFEVYAHLVVNPPLIYDPAIPRA